jgi:hypothetical protein
MAGNAGSFAVGLRGGYSYSYSYSSRWNQGMESRVGRGGSSTSTALRAEYEYEYERESRPRSLADPYWLQRLWRQGRNRYRHRVAGLFDPDSDGDPDTEGILRTAFGVRGSFGMWTPGGPRSSADPGLSAATPSALGSGRPEMRVPSPWMCEGGTRTRADRCRVTQPYRCGSRLPQRRGERRETGLKPAR